MIRVIAAALLASACAATPSRVHADVRVLAHDETTLELRVYSEGMASANAVASAGIGVQAGSVTADASGDRVLFVSNAGAAQSLHSLGYGVLGIVEQAALPPGLRLTHLEWDDSGAGRLVGAALDAATDEARLFAYAGGTLTDLGMPLAICCSFRIGVSAFRASDDSLFLVLRNRVDAQDQIFRFTLSSPVTAASAPIDPDLTLQELAVAPDGSLYGLAYSTAQARTRLVEFDASLTPQLLGAGSDECCLVLTGPVAIEPSSASLVALARRSGNIAPDASRLWRFALADGAVTPEADAIPGLGLWEDATLLVPGDDIFADGFEDLAAAPPRLQRSKR